MTSRITRLGTAPRAAGLDHAAFQQHWRAEHAGLAATLPGLRSYVQNHAVLTDGGLPVLPYAGFDACSEIEFDDVPAMDAAFASDHYQREVSSDELLLIDKPRFMHGLFDRRELRDGDVPEDAVKLLTFWRAAPRATVAELEAAAAGIDTPPAALRHTRLALIDGAHDGGPDPVCDAVDILWFAVPEEALAHVGDPADDAAAWQLGGIGQCIARLVAHEIPIVTSTERTPA